MCGVINMTPFEFYTTLLFYYLFGFGGSMTVMFSCVLFLIALYSVIKGLIVFLYKFISEKIVPAIKAIIIKPAK